MKQQMIMAAMTLREVVCSLINRNMPMTSASSIHSRSPGATNLSNMFVALSVVSVNQYSPLSVDVSVGGGCVLVLYDVLLAIFICGLVNMLVQW